MKLTDDILQVLGDAHPDADGNLLRLAGQLDSTLYKRVDAVLQTVGGRWDKHRKAHVFPGDAWQAVMDLTAQESVTTAAERKQAAQFFPTPPDVADELVYAAGLNPGDVVLEPSAGDGAIVRRLTGRGHPVDCVELDEGHAGALKGCGARTVWVADFLRMPPRRDYDAVIMNPPFTRGADVAHVRHALGFLKPGGRLVSVMLASVQHRGDKAAAAFRELVEERRGWFTEVDAGAFKDSGTEIRTVIAIIPGTEAAKSMPVRPFRVRVNGARIFRIAPYPESFTSCGDDWTPVDCIDVETRMDAQAIMSTADTTDPARLIEEPQIRDAIRSAYANATTPRGRITGGQRLPDDFTVTLCATPKRRRPEQLTLTEATA